MGPWVGPWAHAPIGPWAHAWAPEPMGPWAHDDTPAYHVSRIEKLLRIMILRRIDLAYRTYQTYHVSRISPLSFRGIPVRGR